MIDFNIPIYIDKSQEYIKNAIINHKKLSGDGYYTQKCNNWFEEELGLKKVLLTTSCTHSLEMSAILLNIKEGDEVIAPSFTFVSTINAFICRGAKIVFIDIRPDTMNINEDLIESAITSKTKAIIPVHYAGVACEMDKIMAIAKKYNLYVVEDAAQGVMSTYKGKALGSIGDFGCYSFHETKNYSMGEGGAIVVNNKTCIERAEIVREKGTDRSKFFRGEIDKYTWVDIGSSFLPSELNAAYLYAQLERAYDINEKRIKSWNLYYENLLELEKRGYIKLPYVPKECEHNGHIFYIKVKDLKERNIFIKYLKERGIAAIFHYIPLHSSDIALKYSRFNGKDIYTTKESERLVRLPLYFGIKKSDIKYITNCIREFFLGANRGIK